MLSVEPDNLREEGVEDRLFFGAVVVVGDATAVTATVLFKGVLDEQEEDGLSNRLASGGSTHSVGITHGNMVPNLAARLIHPGADFPVNLLLSSSEK